MSPRNAQTTGSNDDEPVGDERWEPKPPGWPRLVLAVLFFLAALAIGRFAPRVVIIAPALVLVGGYLALTVVAGAFLDR